MKIILFVNIHACVVQLKRLISSWEMELNYHLTNMTVKYRYLIMTFSAI